MWNKTWFRLIAIISLVFTGISLFYLIFIVGIYERRNTKIVRIDRDFSGLNNLLDPEKKTLRLLMVHGIGRHCIGYSDLVMREIATKMDLEVPEKEFDHLVEELDRQRVQEIEFENLTPEEKANRGLIPSLVNSQCELVKPDELGTGTYEDPEMSALDLTCQRIHKNHQQDNSVNCQKIELEFPPRNPNAIRLSPHILGYITTRNYFKTGQPKDSRPALRVYELVWDPSTRWAKQQYTSFDRKFNQRYWLNKKMKLEVVNESISDAIMYLGVYQPLIQFPFLQAYCKLATDKLARENRSDKYKFSCPLYQNIEMGEIPEWQQFLKENKIAIISHSLGTRIVFDTLGLIGEDNFLVGENNFLEKLEKTGVRIGDEFSVEKAIDTNNAIQIRDIFATGLTNIFALTNQVPLLELAQLQNPQDLGRDFTNKTNTRSLGIGFDKFLINRRNKLVATGSQEPEIPLQVTSFTDPDDLLSYDLKCWYYLHVLRYKHSTHKLRRSYADQNKGDDTRFRSFDQHMFKEGCEEKDIVGVVWKDYYEKLWDNEKKFLTIADVTVSLPGISFPEHFTNPSDAHAYFRKVDKINSLIACGGIKNGKIEQCLNPSK